MSGLIITGQEVEETKDEKVEELKLNYEPTEEDEERFFLMYHLKFQPSEAERLHPDYRKWLIARFMGQKQMEQEMVARHRLMNQIGPDLKGGSPFPDLRVRD